MILWEVGLAAVGMETQVLSQAVHLETHVTVRVLAAGHNVAASALRHSAMVRVACYTGVLAI